MLFRKRISDFGKHSSFLKIGYLLWMTLLKRVTRLIAPDAISADAKASLYFFSHLEITSL